MFRAATGALLGLMLGSNMLQAQTTVIDGEIFRDPTRPPSMTAAALTGEVLLGSGALNPANYIVSFIRTGATRPVAVINNQTLTIGDEINGAYVTDIRDREVVLSAQGQEYVLSTVGRSVREPVQ